ncbi:Alpha-(1,3)-fucosyltransferase C [Trichoplax sp. H2]|nr:Alpha-(1,3)-fucosyltransferase C [Trichoplax sp. H2]|eukprot:RDD40404.1 Alpha-(1,3)-fucosyltransferase C [Trichoplax sp. H2]
MSIKRILLLFQASNFFVLLCLTSYIYYTSKRSTTQSVQEYQNLQNLRHNNITIILLWTGWFYGDWPVPLGGHQCDSLSKHCYFTIESKYYSTADAVVFHGSDLYRMEDAALPNQTSKPRHQRWVYYTMENPPISAYLGVQAKERDENKFDWIMSYAKDADVYVPYGQIIKGRYGNGYDSNINYAQGRPKMVAMVASRCYPSRMKMVAALQHYVDVDVYGECGTKCSRNRQCWNHLKQNYKFYLSFENEVCKDYITEKLYNNAFANYLIPIVISGANYSDIKVVPPHSVIDALQFKNVEELARYIKIVAEDNKLYNSYFQWRNRYDIKFIRMRDTLCTLCKKISTKPLRKPSRPYSNLRYILGNHDGNCKKFPEPSRLNAVKPNFTYFQ